VLGVRSLVGLSILSICPKPMILQAKFILSTIMDRENIFLGLLKYEDIMIDVGRIVAVHGIKGEVKVASLSSNPRRFKKGSKLTIEKTGELAAIATVRPQNDLFLIRFEGVEDRNTAEILKGSMLQIPQEDAAPLPNGEYYFFQLEGLEVITEEGESLGTITDLMANGANDVYRVDMGNNDYLLLPALKQVVKKVDLENKKMTVALLPGLLEVCKYHED
ncbi:MAG: ribosome maturation factor RimM, partial [Clostridiales bacterium]